MADVVKIEHPVVAHHLAALRDVKTEPAAFRRLVERLTFVLAVEATRDLTLRDDQVTTPMTRTHVQRLAGRIGLAPILRAGLGMVDPVLRLLPEAEVWHLGLYRDEATLKPVEYYQKLPAGRPVDVAMVLDPMLATGGSAGAALQTLGRWGVAKLKMLALIAAPEGIERLTQAMPEVQIYVCAIDSHLNDQGFIVPGLGDAGDRIFGT